MLTVEYFYVVHVYTLSGRYRFKCKGIGKPNSTDLEHRNTINAFKETLSKCAPLFPFELLTALRL